MKKLNSFLFIAFMTIQNLYASAIDGDIIHEITEGLFVTQLETDLFLVMEKIDPGSEQQEVWENYVAAPKYSRVIGRNPKESAIINSAINDGFGTIKQALKQAGRAEVWIAYASHKNVTEKSVHLENMIEDIEMTVSVTTSDGVPFTTHMGISRTIYHLAREHMRETPKKKHRGISLQLHSFAAKVMKTVHPEKLYMITSPLQSMRSILRKKLKPGTYMLGDNTFYEYITGETLNRSWLESRGLDIEEVKEYMETYPSPMRISERLEKIRRREVQRQYKYEILNADGDAIWERDLDENPNFWFNYIINYSKSRPLFIIDLNTLAELHF